MIDSSGKTVFFGGAGVSTESGIPDFRSRDGLYSEKYGDLPPETIISRTYFEKNPDKFYDFFRDKMLYPRARPNTAHKKLAELEACGKLSCVITQNIDGIHQAA
ncbi:MAG: Sir2 family NAD-dependent protein deacetylase, partial [Candidatus Avispirillum sp.]